MTALANNPAPDAPITLESAAAIAFPDGTMTIRTLRAERDVKLIAILRAMSDMNDLGAPNSAPA